MDGSWDQVMALVVLSVCEEYDRVFLEFSLEGKSSRRAADP